MDIKVLGTGCANCKSTITLIDQIAKAKGVTVNLQKVEELRELFWAEAEKYKVLPLLAMLGVFFGIAPPLPEVSTFEFRGDVENVLAGMVPRIYNHSYTISADLVIPEGGAEPPFFICPSPWTSPPSSSSA